MRTGLNFGMPQRLMTVPGLIDRYLMVLEQCQLDSVRIPLHWRSLVDDDGSFGRGQLVDHYDRFLESLPDGVRVLGLVVSPPESVAQRHFDGIETVTGPYLRFLQEALDRFGRVDELELWNEPNANDFYLSVADAESHRPWTPDEFVDAVVLPGVEFMHAQRPEMPLCVVSFSENGLVGHDYLPGAPSGLLPRNERFERLRDAEQGSHGRFHFVPSFGPRVISRLAAEVSLRPGDAVALHPYPYFEPAADQTYSDKTLGLVDDALEYLAPLRERGAELWLTEVGCRSHDPRESNQKRSDDQATFVEAVFSAAPQRGIDRIYWYKFDDAVGDLRQEKTFGLFDRLGKARPAYRAFRSRNRALVEGGARTVVVSADELVDGDDLSVEKDNIRALIDGSLEDLGTGALVFAGRDDGDGVEFTSALGVSFGSDLLLSASVSPVGPPAPGVVRLELVDGERIAVSVELGFMRGAGWMVAATIEETHAVSLTVAADDGALGGFGLRNSDESAEVFVVVGEEQRCAPIDRPIDLAGRVLIPRMRIENRENSRAMWEFVRLVASADTSSPLWPHKHGS